MAIGPARATAAHRDLRLVVAVFAGDGLGFRLAGVPVVEVASGDEARVLRELRATAGVGVIAAEAALLTSAGEDQPSRRAPGLPIVLPFTLPRSWSEERRGSAFIAALVRRAVGYHVKLGGRP
jgi:V/A-type H+/Na+-transporting ATPase subunit F